MLNETLLKTYIGALLVEAKADNLKKKFPSLAHEIDKLNQSLPAKYLDWAVKQLDAGSSVNDIVPTLQFFHKNINRFLKKDVNAYKTLKELEDEIKSLKPEVPSSSEKRKETKLSGVEKIFSDKRWDLLWIKSKEASMCYGTGTKWCITMRDAKYWEQYTDDNVVFYFLIDKTLDAVSRYHKIAFAVIRELTDNSVIKDVESYDAQDDMFDSFPSWLAKFEELIINDAKTRESTSKYVLMTQGKASAEDVLSLIKDPDHIVREKVAQGIDPSHLPKMMNDESNYVRMIVTKRIDPSYLPEMMNDKYSWVRTEVAKRIGEVHLAEMMNDKDKFVRAAVATRIDPSYLPEMINDKHYGVREAIAQRIDPSYLPKMINDPFDGVRMRVAKRIDQKYLPKMLRDNSTVGAHGVVSVIRHRQEQTKNATQ